MTTEGTTSMKYPLEDHTPAEEAKVAAFWPLNPDCRDGKHPACNGDAWDNETDQPTACGCACHEEVA